MLAENLHDVLRLLFQKGDTRVQEGAEEREERPKHLGKSPTGLLSLKGKNVRS